MPMDDGLNLGKASLDLDVNLATFKRNMREGRSEAGGMEDALDAVAAIANIAEHQLGKVKMDSAAATESRAIADRIERSVGSVGRAAMEASQHLQEVKLSAEQAAETDVAGDVIDRKLNEIGRNADQAKRKLAEVGLVAGAEPRNPGSGVGPFGSGYGRIGLLGTAVGLGALTAPAAAPAAVGLLAAIPALAGMGAGALGTLALAFDGVTKAIGGDLKAYKDLNPTAQQFVQTVRSLDGWIDQLKETADKALFPGLTAGLKAALSPGTISAIAIAIREFATAIGAAGEAWGKYFGSQEFRSIFGPIMATGAHNLGLLSSAALSLFDALGVLARAALPLTTWLTQAAASGARLVDTWLHAKDASGQLGSAMNEMQRSLALVGGLLASLGRAVGALGTALYPVSKVAVKDLTDALNGLASWISRNQTVIRELVGGALSDLVAVVKIAGAAVSAFYHSMKNDLGNSAPIVAGIAAIGAAIAISLGPEAVVITGAIVATGEIIRHWGAVKVWFVDFGKFIEQIFQATWQGALGIIDGAIYGMLLEVRELAEGLSKALGWVPGIGGKIKAAMQDVVSFVDQFKNEAAQHFAEAGQLAGSAWGDAFKSSAATAITSVAAATAAAASGAVDPETAAKAAHGVATSKGVPAATGSGKYTSQQVYQLLINAGFQPNDAANFVGIAQAESGFRYNALNDNPSTGDYSAGLFQENFYKGLGPARTARYAPQFGLSANMSPSAFVAWLRQHPAAQAKIALDLFSSSGYQPWMGDAFVKAHPELLSSGTTTDVFGTPPPFTKNLGPKPPKPSPIPTLASHLANLATVNAGKASGLANVGQTAKRYLQDELMDLNAEQKSLQAAYDKAHGKAKTQIGNALAQVEAKIPKVQKLIADAIVKTGAALLPDELKTRLTAQQVKFKADSTLAQSLTGKAAQDFQSTLLTDLNGEQKTLAAEVTSLKAMLDSAHGKQKTAIKTELAKVRTQLQKVNEQVVESLQQTVSTLQGQVGTAFGNVTQELDTQFEQATQKLLDAAAVTYFQNGAKTPLEQQLADMQAADQLQSLQDAVAQATDAKTRAAAQRQLDEYNLSIRAAAERANADAQYAAETKRIQTDRSATEAKMNAQLATLGDALQNGSGSVSDLATIAAAYGVQIDTTTIPDFDNLSGSVAGLQTAMDAYTQWLSKTTGVTVKIPTSGSGTTGAATSMSATSMSAIYKRAVALAGGTLPPNIHYPGIPQLDIGGEVIQSGLAMVHRGEFFTGVHGEALGAGGDLHLTLKVNDREFARAILPAFRSQLNKKRQQNVTLELT